VTLRSSEMGLLWKATGIFKLYEHIAPHLGSMGSSDWARWLGYCMWWRTLWRIWSVRLRCTDSGHRGQRRLAIEIHCDTTGHGTRNLARINTQQELQKAQLSLGWLTLLVFSNLQNYSKSIIFISSEKEYATSY